MQRSSILLIAIFAPLALSGCGSDSQNGDKAQPYQVTASPWADEQNVYSHLKTASGECVNTINGGPVSNCVEGDNRSVTQYKSGSGFIGFPYGLAQEESYSLTASNAQRTTDVYKYSGPMGTFSSKHYPVAVNSGQYTYFVYAGPALLDDEVTVASVQNKGKVTTADTFKRPQDQKSNALGIYVGRFNNETHKVAAPILLHVKNTDDPHDNAVLNMDNDGNLYVLIAGRALNRSALLFYLQQPDASPVFNSSYINITDISPENLNYQGYSQGDFIAPDLAPITYPKLLSTDDGLLLIYSLYCNKQSNASCRDNTRQLWQANLTYTPETDTRAQLSNIRPLAAREGHYAVAYSSGAKVAIAFNEHLNGSSDDRSNLFLLLSDDSGKTWQYIDRHTGVAHSAEPLLPLTSRQQLNQIAVHMFTSEGTTTYQRVYLKSVLLNDSAELQPSILFTLASGSDGYEPTLNPIHQLRVTQYKDGQWQSLSQQNVIDHNYSAGHLTYSADNGAVQAIIPAATVNNGLAGGTPAIMTLTGNAPYPLTLLADENHASSAAGTLCEANYIRGVAKGASDGFIAITNLSNPHHFESLNSNDNLPASPIVIIDAAGNMYRLPMHIATQDLDNELALEEINNIMECQ